VFVPTTPSKLTAAEIPDICHPCETTARWVELLAKYEDSKKLVKKAEQHLTRLKLARHPYFKKDDDYARQQLVDEMGYTLEELRNFNDAINSRLEEQSSIQTHMREVFDEIDGRSGKAVKERSSWRIYHREIFENGFVSHL
jgi:hypothetical protein